MPYALSINMHVDSDLLFSYGLNLLVGWLLHLIPFGWLAVSFYPIGWLAVRFQAECHVDADGQVTCHGCPPQYTGRRCEQCAPGFQGNPLMPGETCQPGKYWL